MMHAIGKPYNHLDHVPYGLNTWCCSQHTRQRQVYISHLEAFLYKSLETLRNGLLLLALYHSKQVKVLATVLLSYQERYNPLLSNVFWTSQLSLCSLSQLSNLRIVGEKRGFWLIPQRPLISTNCAFFPLFFCLNQQKSNPLKFLPLSPLRILAHPKNPPISTRNSFFSC